MKGEKIMNTQKGQRDKLEKYLNTNQRIEVVMNASGPSIYDFTCFGLDVNGKLSDDSYMIFYNQTSSPEGAISYTQGGNRAVFGINLSLLPAKIQKLAFTMSIDGSGNMGMLQRHTVQIMQNNQSALELSLSGLDFQRETAIITMEIYKKDVWRFSMIASGFNGGLGDLLRYYGGKELQAQPAPAFTPTPMQPQMQTQIPTPIPIPMQTQMPMQAPVQMQTQMPMQAPVPMQPQMPMQSSAQPLTQIEAFGQMSMRAQALRPKPTPLKMETKQPLQTPMQPLMQNPMQFQNQSPMQNMMYAQMPMQNQMPMHTQAPTQMPVAMNTQAPMQTPIAMNTQPPMQAQAPMYTQPQNQMPVAMNTQAPMQSPIAMNTQPPMQEQTPMQVYPPRNNQPLSEVALQQNANGLSLEKKLQQNAPKLVSLAKPLKVELEKKNLMDCVARVALVLDISGSMSMRYKNGTVQEIVNKTLPLAVQFDDDGELDFWYYGTTCRRMPSVNMRNYESAVPYDWKSLMTSIGGRNNEVLVMNDIMDKYRDTKLPVYVLFITDGGVTRATEIKKILKEASKKPVFWQFVGVGGSNYGVLEQLDTLQGRYVDNANFFALDDFMKVRNSDLYARLLNEFPQWLKAIKVKGMIRG